MRLLTWICVAVALYAIGFFLLKSWPLVLLALGVIAVATFLIDRFKPLSRTRIDRRRR